MYTTSRTRRAHLYAAWWLTSIISAIPGEIKRISRPDKAKHEIPISIISWA
jgi:hypothetical protein